MFSLNIQTIVLLNKDKSYIEDKFSQLSERTETKKIFPDSQLSNQYMKPPRPVSQTYHHQQLLMPNHNIHEESQKSFYKLDSSSESKQDIPFIRGTIGRLEVGEIGGMGGMEIGMGVEGKKTINKQVDLSDSSPMDRSNFEQWFQEII